MNSHSTELRFAAKRLGQTPHDGTLVFDESGITFHPSIDRHPKIHIASSEIRSYSIDRQDTRKEDVSFLGVFLIGMFAFLFPSKSGDLSITMTIKTTNEWVRFKIDEEAIEGIQSNIGQYLS